MGTETGDCGEGAAAGSAGVGGTDGADVAALGVFIIEFPIALSFDKIANESEVSMKITAAPTVILLRKVAAPLPPKIV